MKKPSKTERKPAEVVKCPYCDHVGSARGLFSHVRLAHQGKNVNTRKEWIKNPYSIEKHVPKQRVKMEHRIGAKYAAPKTFGEVIGTALIIGAINAFIDHINKEMPKGESIGYIPMKNNP